MYGTHSPVVGGRKDRDALAIMCHLVALGFDFVATDDVIEVVAFQETFCDIWSELAAHPTLADGPAVLTEGKREEKEALRPKAHSTTKQRGDTLFLVPTANSPSPKHFRPPTLLEIGTLMGLIDRDSF